MRSSPTATTSVASTVAASRSRSGTPSSRSTRSGWSKPARTRSRSSAASACSTTSGCRMRRLATSSTCPARRSARRPPLMPARSHPMPLSPHMTLDGSARWIKRNYPDVVAAAGTTYSNLGGARLPEPTPHGDVRADRLHVSRSPHASNVNETAWGPILVGMKNAGVRVLQHHVHVRRDLAAHEGDERAGVPT